MQTQAPDVILTPKTIIFESISSEKLDAHMSQERRKMVVDPQIPSIAIHRTSSGLRLRTQAGHGTREWGPHAMNSSDCDLQELDEFCQWLIQIGGPQVLLLLHRPNATPCGITMQELYDMLNLV
jgi:hypothetical protein